MKISKTAIFPQGFFLLLWSIAFLACQGQSDSQSNEKLNREKILTELSLENIQVIEKSEEFWSNQLTNKEYHILREKGTEPRYSSDLLNEKRQGLYVCAGCQLPLFSSDTKYKSGTGWPSFYDVLGNHVEEKADGSYGMSRTEVICRRCKGHLGHVFSDGPDPTGLRYCINGVSLNFLALKE
jgi:peptide-methionine (R)-S-oxide reductase